MGYPQLYYDEYYDNIDYWMGDLGVQLPKWADEVSALGCPGVSAYDFYEDLFGDYLEDHKEDPEDYESGEYAAIAVELKRRNVKGKLKTYANRKTITNGCMELYDMIEDSENFCLMSAASYIGYQRKDVNARDLFALVIEIDDLQDDGIEFLPTLWNRKSHRMPQPTYIVCSGSGIHLYYVFEKPIPLWPNVLKRLGEIKTYMCKWLWDKPVTKSYNNIQYEPVLQGFRIVGTRSKSGGTYAMAFESGPRLTIEKFNSCMPPELQLEAFYKSNLSLEEAKKLYPKWYQRRIIEGKSPGTYNRHPGIYYDWVEKIKTGASLGHRYNCLENLCSLAVQCEIPPEQVEKDVREVAEILEDLTRWASNDVVQKHGHFTEYDIMSALRTYFNPSRSAYTRKREIVSKKTNIPLEPNRRNYQKQEDHLEEARSIRDIRCKRRGKAKWYDGGGRPDKKNIVQEWRKAHPDGRKADCIKDTGLSKPTVLKWWENEEGGNNI